MSVFTIIYDTIGGIKAVVFSDVIQMFILLTGILFSIFFALKFAGGIEVMLESIHPDRLKALDFFLGLQDGSATPFWGFLVGGQSIIPWRQDLASITHHSGFLFLRYCTVHVLAQQKP